MFSFVIAALVGSLISAGASLATNAMNIANNDVQNQLDREHESSENALDRSNEQFIKQMEINQENYMASNKHQMEVEDLKAAGLNPALSSGGLSTGTTAQGSSKASGSISGNVNSYSNNAMVPLLGGIVASGVKHSTDAKYFYNKIQSETRTSAFQTLDSMKEELDL